ncbi:MAG: tRNA methyltransferase [Thermoplasmata archaeon]|nr:MAG: tRNA methyltransferase [Thermoplasmata archaeon]
MNSSYKLLSEINPAFVRRYEQIDCSREFFSSLTTPLRQSVRVNTLKGKYEDIVALLNGKYDTEKIPWCREGFFISGVENIGRTPEHAIGLVFSQEAASMIPVVVLNPKPDDVVLDMAAAPGAKTTQIAQYMENKGCIVANDVKDYRINMLVWNLQRCGVYCAIVTRMDGRFFQRCNERFDKILLDAPCSNVGMIRKNYKYLREWSMKSVINLSRLQKSLIISAYASLKPGGVLVYSTCTLDPVENEEVVSYLLEKTDARLEKINLPLNRHEPIVYFNGREYLADVKKCLRIHPQDNDTEGFFVAKVVKP